MGTQETKMFPIPQLWKGIRGYLPKFLILVFASPSLVKVKSKMVYAFVAHLNKMYKHHGADFTVQWMKSCFVCLQRYLGDDRIASLRDIQSDLPLPRLINGLPMIIPKSERSRISRGEPKAIQFWLSLFSLYRISSCGFKSKLNSITDPYNGKDSAITDFSKYISGIKGNPFKNLKSWKDWSDNINLYPSSFSFIQSASPSNSISWHGLLTDYKLLKDLDLLPKIELYLSKVGSLYFEDLLQSASDMYSRLHDIAQEAYRVKNPNSTHAGLKDWIPSHKTGNYSGLCGQLAYKEEAAGKLRVFAMVDIWTQNVLRPLHQSLFDLLKRVPNDGTFDQDASVKRSISKSLVSGCAYSFDLSSATDRLPISIQIPILNILFPKQEIGSVWADLLVGREYYNPGYKDIVEKGKVKYAVGQPMGALSSWAMLAVTHHYLLQYCSYLIGSLQSWETNYEILGDDLVIFDHKLAQKYLEITKDLGVDINLSKSIVSPAKSSFEFAKRTIYEGTNVSSLSFKQLLSETSVAGRLANILYYAKLGLVRTNTVLSSLLSRFGKVKSNKDLLFPLAALLGVFFKQKKISHSELFGMFVDPESLEWESPTLPYQGLLTYCKGMLNEVPSPSISHSETRKEVGAEMMEILADYIILAALDEAKKIERNIDSWKASAKTPIFGSWKTLLNNDVLAANCIFPEEWLFEVLDNHTGFDPTEYVDEIHKIAIRQAKIHDKSVEEALSILDRTLSLAHRFNLSKTTPKIKMTEGTSPIFSHILSNIGEGSRNYYKARPDYWS